MLVSIHSTNPNFMSILRKNPDSFNGLQLRTMRNGVAIGRVMNPSRYDLVFQDTKYSFSEDASNQIDFMSYCSPVAFLGMMSIFFRHMLVEADRYYSEEIPWLGQTLGVIDTSGYQNEMRIENLYADGFTVQRGSVLSKYFPEVSFQHKVGKLYTLTIKTEGSVFRLFNLAALCMVYTAATNKQRWWIARELAAKYIRVMQNLSPVPYFIVHLFNRHCIRKQEDFEYFKSELEKCADDVDLIWGNTQVMRMEEVGQRLLVDNVIPYNVVEIGCGEMDYPRRFLKRVTDGHMWYANDLTDYGYIAQRIRKYTQCKNLWFTSDLDGLPEIQNVFLLMVEVIEHMPLENAREFLQNNLKRFQPKRGIVTTPNRSFNSNFEINRENTFRHRDHQFEFSTEEFRNFILGVVEPLNYQVEFFGIGDKVRGEYLSLGVEFKRSENE